MVLASTATTDERPLLQVVGLEHKYGDGKSALPVFRDLSLEVRQGDLLSIVGPSGCGKTTLLRCLSGLMQPTGGSVALEGEVVRGVPEHLGMVFQDYSRSLYPWRTVEKNVLLPLKYRSYSRAQAATLVEESLTAVGLRGFGGSYPWQLSGGMQQRVAIARALAYRPKVLLMDEPFASVDAQTRSELEDLTLGVQREYGMTIVLVTHDIDESVYMANRVVVLSKSPARVIDEVSVPLGSRRDQITTRESNEFVKLRGRIARLIQEQSGQT